jgi:hypothetical protein
LELEVIYINLINLIANTSLIPTDINLFLQGLDDATNIARILIRLAKDGCPIKVNAHIKKSLAEIEPAPGNDQQESDDE